MKRILVHPITAFVFGIILAIGTLALKDYNYLQTAAPAVEQPTRSAFATRTVALRPTPTATELPSVTPPPTEIAAASATPELAAMAVDSSPTPTSALEFTSSQFTSTVTTTASVTITQAATQATVRRTAAAVAVRATSTPTATVNSNKGDSPYTALEMNDTWTKIAPGAFVWYKAGVRTAFPLRGTIWLDANLDENGRRGLDLAIYSPEQNDLLSDPKPIGRGSYNKIEPRSALLWKGGSPNAGIWYAKLANKNTFTVDYKIGTTLTVTDPKNCFQYGEYLPDGRWIIWTECNRPGP